MLNQMVIKRHGLRSKSKLRGGNRKPQTFKICICGKEFGPIYALKQKFCSKRCAYDHAPKTSKFKHVRTKDAARAHGYLAYCIKSGKITRPNKCEQCGSTHKKIEGAHFNYIEPLNVRWLCRSCHIRWDKEQPKGGTELVARWEKYTGKKALLKS